MVRPILVWQQENHLIPNGVACHLLPHRHRSPRFSQGRRPGAACPGRPRRSPGGRGRPPRHLADLPLSGRREAVAGLGQPPFRASQLSRHFFGRYTDQADEMSDLPRDARDPLAKALLPRLLTAERELSCDDGTTRKTLWRTFDGALVESVLMRYPDRVTMCVSSQAGCGMACPFCATGQAGLTRNLSTAEIVAQVVAGARLLAAGQVPGGRWPRLQRRVHGHGGAAGQLRQRAGRRAPADRPGARGHGHLPALGHGLHGGPGPGHRPPGRRTSLRHPGRVPARPGRRTARHAGAGQPAVEGGRGAGRRLGLRRGHRPPDLDRVRPDQGRQRPGLAGRPAGLAAGRAARPRQPDPAQPDARVPVDRVAARRAARVRPPPGGARRPGHGAGHPGPRDRRCLRPAGRVGQ